MLHGNAALGWHGRRFLAQRVVVDGWTLAAAAEAAGVSVRCARKWVGRYRLEGELGLNDRSSAAGREPYRARPGRSDREAAPAAFHRRRDRRDARDGALDGVGDPDADRDGQAGPARA